MNMYVFSNDGATVIGGISMKNREGEAGWFKCFYSAPTVGDGEFAVCIGFVREGEGFRALFEVRKQEDCEDATEADKDAALRRFGVEV